VFNCLYLLEGDDLKSENPAKAMELLEKVVHMEKSLGVPVKWSVFIFALMNRLIYDHSEIIFRRFKALQLLVTLYFSIQEFGKMIASYQEMLELMTMVTRNECTDAINSVLDTLINATDVNMLSEMYEITLLALKTANNERLWFNTNVKLAKVYLEAKRYDDVERIVTMLIKSCQAADGTDDKSKGAYLLEAYCLQIQLCAVSQNTARMKQIYPKTVQLNSAVSDPRIMAVIREEGGKMYMSEGLWNEAYNELYEAFRNYQEAGNSRAKDCLKYVVLASMLALNKINPFAAREAKVFTEDKEIVAMSELRSSLENNDLPRFERILRNKQNRICDEPLLLTYIQPLRKRMREQVPLLAAAALVYA
jgi:COP9 signalosome complex subunit 2